MPDRRLTLLLALWPALLSPPLFASEGTAAASPEASAARGTATAEDPRDLVLLHDREAASMRMVRTLDGGPRLASPEELQRRGYRLCIVTFPNDYQALAAAAGDDALQGLGQAEVQRLLEQLAGGRAGTQRRTDCLRTEGQRMWLSEHPEMLAVQRRALPVLQASVRGFDRYAPLHDVRYPQLLEAADQARAARQQATDAARQRAQDLAALASAGSQEHVASLTLSQPTDDKLRYCTLTYADAEGAAVLGYAHRGMEWVSPAMRARVEERRAAPQGRSPFARAFADVDAFYVEQQKSPGQCHVYVDFPRNIQRLMGALERDQGTQRFELNAIVPAASLRDAWARRNGHADWAANEFARSIKASAQQVRTLAEHGIENRPAYDAALAEMQAGRYASSSELSDVLDYLRDRAAASKGQTALVVRQERERSERAAAEQRAAEERRRQSEHAREFPYTATLTCGMGGRHLSIMACFTGRHTKSQLELRNGAEYKMLQAWELRQAGRESTEGLVIPLRRNFSLQAQNTDANLILSLRIRDNASGRTVYEKSASQFGVVAARN